ncbi:MAG TPA: NAD(P)/FAD-dependent oxidoreductase [Plantibacter sp.]|uniref:FAD-dependent oxidoreductase n=1 Tax=unclassified Plantibacter TaxID=2624265 RepID=UPI002C9CFE99|nr:NAD(P)/FAD-dependent oxidoreductase [Plantibacter sp.]
MPDVLIVGGGPVGLVVALLLARDGIDVEVWEGRSDPPSGTRAIGVHPPSLDLFDGLGVLGPFLEHAVRIGRGEAWNGGRRLGTVLFDDRPFDHPFIAALEQWRTEQLLRARLHAVLPGALRTGIHCTTLLAGPDGVQATGTGGPGAVSTRAAMVVVASGGRTSFDAPPAMGRVRQYRDGYLMGDVLDQSDAGAVARVFLHRHGVVESFPLPAGKRRYVVHTGLSNLISEPTADDLAALVSERTGDSLDPTTNSMLSAFVVRRRQRRSLVAGRIVHVGDAAHEISPIGGQGMNLGWADARAFAPGIVRAVRSGAPDAARLTAVSDRQLSLARRAARQAELNMALGRPHGSAVGSLRDLGLRTVLRSPVMPVLADAYTMRWAR